MNGIAVNIAMTLEGILASALLLSYNDVKSITIERTIEMKYNHKHYTTTVVCFIVICS